MPSMLPRAGHSPSVRAAAAILVFLLLPALWPAPARCALFSFTIKDEKELGEKFNVLIRSRLPMVQDPEIHGYVEDLVRRIAAATPPQPFNLTVGVVRNGSMNAFAAPAGYVFVFTGLIQNLDHESELAAVIAHELAHVTQRHIAGRVETMQLLSIAQVLGLVAGFALGQATDQKDLAGALMIGTQAATAQTYLNYSRQDEQEADQVGMGYLVGSGFRPQGMAASFDTMRRMKWLKGGGDIPTYLSTHPGIPERIGYLKDRVNQMPPDVQGRKDDDTRFLRVRMLTRARYLDPDIAVTTFRKMGENRSCLDQLGYAIALGRTSNMPEARAAFEKALACGGDDALWLREAGRFFFKVRDFDRARKLLESAAKKNPQDVVSQYELARILAHDGDTPRAIQIMQRLRLTASEDADLHATYGQLLGQSGDIFHAHLHLAYAAVYDNDKRQSRMLVDKVKAMARTDEDKREVARLEKTLKERSEHWKKGLLK